MMLRICLRILFILLSCSLYAQERNRNSSYTAKDSIVSPVSLKYQPRSFMHRMIMGTNYRETWSTAVKFPVFYLSASEFSIEKLGGGEQTKSLRLRDRKGRRWVLRTVDKDVSPAIPKQLRNTFVKNIVQDMISASYPYSHIIVGKLSEAAGIIAPMPEMYYVADDTALAMYRSIFAGTICTLEQYEPTPDGSSTKETEEVLEKIREGDNLVLQKKFLKIRLMDVLVGDWDRHMDQLRWGSIDSTDLTLHYAIPRDRDNALFHAGGLLAFLAKISFMPHLTGFKKNSSNIKMLSKKAWDLDHSLLNKLDAAAWEETIKEIQKQITDTVIETTIKSLPAEVVALDGEELISKLKSRRDGLFKNGMDYYSFLSSQVTINGSDEEDLFVVSGKHDQLQVTIYQLKKNQQLKIYERTFPASETKLVYLNGLKGDDRFLLEETAGTKIRLKVAGNEGRDIYEVKGRAKNKVLDTQPEDVVKTGASVSFVK